MTQEMTTRVKDAVYEVCKKYDLRIEFVASMIEQECGGKFIVSRYEPGFYRRNLATKNRRDLAGHVPEQYPNLTTEKVHRSTSWGAMQPLGETARVMGYAEDELSLLIFPEPSIEYGCKYLRKLLNLDADKTIEQHRESTKFFKTFFSNQKLPKDEKIIRAFMAWLRYNGGGNIEYPFEVWAKFERGSYKKMLGDSQ